jgi:hypothetical protein
VFTLTLEQYEVANELHDAGSGVKVLEVHALAAAENAPGLKVKTMRLLIVMVPETQRILRDLLDGKSPAPKVFVPEIRPGNGGMPKA